jgi:hypothetical protein
VLLSIVGAVAVATGGDISITSTVAPMAAVTGLLVGAILVSRLPRQPIGWLLWTSGLLFALTRITQGLADRGLTADPGSVPGAIWFAWVNTWVGTPGFLLLGVLLPLLYPTGRPPSPHWRPLAIVVMVELAALSAVAAISPFPSGTYPPGVQNPLAPGGLLGDELVVVQNVLSLALLLLLGLALASLVVRYRRAKGIEREQLKWFAFVGAIAITALAIAGLFKGSTGDVLATIDWFGWLIGIGGLVLMPVAIGIAVLRYRLYEIDRLISRTISWASVSAVLVAVFVAVILVTQAVLASITSSNTIAVAASTLVVFAIFQPLRRRVQARVDRRFNRARYDAERTVAAFAGRLRDEVDLGQLTTEIAAAVDATLQPVSVSLWLRR